MSLQHSVRTQQPEAAPVDRAMPSPRQHTASRPAAHPALRLQRLVGNRAVGQVIKAKLIAEERGDALGAKDNRDHLMMQASVQAARGRGEALLDPLRSTLEHAEAADFFSVGVHAWNRAVSPGVQAKLRVNQPDDAYEREADRVAAHVVDRINTPANPDVERQTVAQQYDDLLLREPMRGSVPSEEEPIAVTPRMEAAVAQAAGGGQPLSASIREPMERAFGTRFTGVRIHTDAVAHDLNNALDADAFTSGQDIFFRQGSFDPGHAGGQHLLAHELTHVVQQSSGRTPVASNELGAISKAADGPEIQRGKTNTKKKKETDTRTQEEKDADGEKIREQRAEEKRLKAHVPAIVSKIIEQEGTTDSSAREQLKAVRGKSFDQDKYILNLLNKGLRWKDLKSPLGILIKSPASEKRSADLLCELVETCEGSDSVLADLEPLLNRADVKPEEVAALLKREKNPRRLKELLDAAKNKLNASELQEALPRSRTDSLIELFKIEQVLKLVEAGLQPVQLVELHASHGTDKFKALAKWPDDRLKCMVETLLPDTFLQTFLDYNTPEALGYFGNQNSLDFVEGVFRRFKKAPKGDEAEGRALLKAAKRDLRGATNNPYSYAHAYERHGPRYEETEAAASKSNDGRSVWDNYVLLDRAVGEAKEAMKDKVDKEDQSGTGIHPLTQAAIKFVKENKELDSEKNKPNQRQPFKTTFFDPLGGQESFAPITQRQIFNRKATIGISELTFYQERGSKTKTQKLQLLRGKDAAEYPQYSVENTTTVYGKDDQGRNKKGFIVTFKFMNDRYQVLTAYPV